MNTLQFAEMLFKSLWGLWVFGIIMTLYTIYDKLNKSN